MKPRLLDLFCGAGGAATGYARAGFDVVGVDIKPQPRYPFEMYHDDALAILRHGIEHGTIGMFDAIHASPPCQAYSRATAWRGNRSSHPDLIAPTRELLLETGLPYVIETVREGRRLLRNPLMLCGSAVGVPVQRHRYFEANWPLSLLTHPCRHEGLLPFEHKGERAYADAMGCEWMTVLEGREAIPPAYTELIGHQLMQHLQAKAAA